MLSENKQKGTVVNLIQGKSETYCDKRSRRATLIQEAYWTRCFSELGIGAECYLANASTILTRYYPEGTVLDRLLSFDSKKERDSLTRSLASFIATSFSMINSAFGEAPSRQNVRTWICDQLIYKSYILRFSRLHQCSGKTSPHVLERFLFKIKKQSNRIDIQRELRKLPDRLLTKNEFYFYDFHPNNILVDGDGFKLIDLEHFKAGHPGFVVDLLFLNAFLNIFGAESFLDDFASEVSLADKHLDILKRISKILITAARKNKNFSSLTRHLT